MGGDRGHALADNGIVGRDEELATLDRVLTDSCAGRLGLVLVEGEGGIGKTRLVRALAAGAATRGVRAMAGACLALGTTIPYLPFAEMLRDLVRDLSDQERAALLGPGGEILAPLLRPDATPRTRQGSGHSSGDDSGDGSGEMARLAMFESLLRMTERLASRQPLLVILEDIQWADRATLDLVTFLARNLRAARIMLVMTVRTGGPASDAVAPFAAGLERHQRVERIELGPLGLEDTGRQLAGILGTQADPDVVRQIHRRSGGNPLFAGELLAWTRSGASRDAATSPRLRDMVADRVGQLPAEAHGVLRLASAAGRIVDDDLLVEACGLPAPTISAGIRAAVSQGLLVPARFEGREGYAFRHDLVREAVAAELLPGERARLHEAFALALTSGHARPADFGELAYHWDAAGEDGRALAAHIDAGIAAQRVFAFEAAQAHFERALELWPLVPAADDLTAFDRIDLAQAAAAAAAMAGDHERAIELSRGVLAALGPDTGDERALAARERLRRSLWESGDTAGALVEAEIAVRLIGPEPGPAQAGVLGHLAALLLFTGNVRRARIVATQALEMAMAFGAREAAALAGGVLGWSLMYAGRVEESVALIRAGADAADQLGEIHGRVLAADHLARALELAGRAEEAEGIALAGAELCRSHGLGRTFGALLAADGVRCLRGTARLDEAATLVTTGLAEEPVGPGQIALLAAAALVHVDRDDLRAAEDALDEATALARAAGDLDSAGWIAAASASIALRRGDPGRALALLRELTRVGAGDGRDFNPARGRTAPVVSPQASMVQLGASVGPLLRLAAWAIADIALLDRARGLGVAGDGAATRVDLAGDAPAPDTGRLQRLLDWLAARRELAAAFATDLALADAELQRATAPASDGAAAAWARVIEIDQGRPSPSPAAQAYACLRLGEALVVRRDRRKDAAAAVRDGLAIASSHGLLALEADLALLARRARLEVGPRGVDDGRGSPDGAEPVDGNPFGLTDREVEVLRLVAAGMTNREIGERLFMSPKTASVHVSSILGKLGVPGRLDAALIAQQVGMYEPAGTGA